MARPLKEDCEHSNPACAQCVTRRQKQRVWASNSIGLRQGKSITEVPIEEWYPYVEDAPW